MKEFPGHRGRLREGSGGTQGHTEGCGGYPEARKGLGLGIERHTRALGRGKGHI